MPPWRTPVFGKTDRRDAFDAAASVLVRSAIGRRETSKGRTREMLRCVRSAVYMSLSALAALAFVAKPLPGQDPQSLRLNLEPCRVTGVGREVRCSHLSVSEDPANDSGRQITLNIVVLPARTPEADSRQDL